MATVTLCSNNKEFSLSQFTSHAFNSAVVFNGKLLIANSTGVFQADKSIPVDSYIVFPTSDFGYLGKKGLRSILLEGKFSGAMLVSVEYDDGTIFLYQTTDISQSNGCKLALKSIKRSRMFKVKISNVSGADFSLTSAKVIFIPGPERRM